jgi:hypothetical protein
VKAELGAQSEKGVRLVAGALPSPATVWWPAVYEVQDTRWLVFRPPGRLGVCVNDEPGGAGWPPAHQQVGNCDPSGVAYVVIITLRPAAEGMNPHVLVTASLARATGRHPEWH